MFCVCFLNSGWWYDKNGDFAVLTFKTSHRLLLLSGGRRDAPVDHGTERLWEKLSVQDPQRLVAGVRRPATQTLSRTHVLHPSEVHTHKRTLVLIVELLNLLRNLICRIKALVWDTRAPGGVKYLLHGFYSRCCIISAEATENYSKYFVPYK